MAKRFGDALVGSPEVPMGKDRIVAVGFLTDADLRLLGERFDRYFPVEQEDVFADLIAELDKVEAIPFEKGVSIQRKSDR
ncbi:hypothetical protein OK349_17520 [Sphingomonas sp. BT-65]|uniref:hypothetical protein n=1 Tax=Sphingomonas sp. BT-65 TaxID=2989821 RepID=UPI002235E079|nr:hypothetical protein [Sphingomonas sp. BT-65]MCW4463511.1 hypothetical protein [Sphingomonas sp. BT-65]